MLALTPFEPLKDAWAYAEPVLWLLTMGFTVSIWLRLRAARRRSAAGVRGEPVILNLSGHPVAASEGGWAAGVRTVGEALTLKAGSSAELDEEVRSLLASLPADLHGRLLGGDPNVVVALPGLAPLTYHLVVHLHGLMGHFPNVTYPLRIGEAYEYVRPVSGQSLRLESRTDLRTRT